MNIHEILKRSYSPADYSDTSIPELGNLSPLRESYTPPLSSERFTSATTSDVSNSRAVSAAMRALQ